MFIEYSFSMYVALIEILYAKLLSVGGKNHLAVSALRDLSNPIIQELFV